MSPWPKYPVIYEINTWVWLNDLGRRHGRPVTLSSVPAAEWDAMAALGVDAVWLMGVWERSPAGIRVALRNEGLMADFRRALPDAATADVVGSPYCVRRYVVDAQLGGTEGLAAARRMLRERGVRLILDFVPNHVAPDHPWVLDYPGYFIRGDRDDLMTDPASYLEVGGNVYACGRDPYFPAWPDVLQLNAFDAGLRRAARDTVASIAEQCDGIRCDMAMLLLNAVFERTWGSRARDRPQADYWREVIPSIKARWPEFLFIAEAYWDLEWELQQQGFDYCYDKRLYDRLEHGDAEAVRLHLLADLAYQQRLVRFIENHDEPRAAATFSPEKSRAAAVVALTLPGARLLHEGQMEGFRVRLPVFLGRRSEEPVDADLVGFYRRLLAALNRPAFRDGRWQLCERSGWPDNPTWQRILAWCWARDDERYLIVVNLADQPAQARVEVPWEALPGRAWRLIDVLSGDGFERSGDEMRDVGLYVALAPWSTHFLRVSLP
jgi:glycosidase